jgi:hypothetical protein
MISSQASHKIEAAWSPHTADHTRSPSAERRENVSSRHRFRDSELIVHDGAAANVAAVYNQAGGDYVAYGRATQAHSRRNGGQAFLLGVPQGLREMAYFSDEIMH